MSGYRTVSASSSVDESLFGFKHPHRSKQQQQQQQQAPSSAPAATHGRRARQRETVEIVTSEGIRKLTVPVKEPPAGPLVLSRREFARLQHNATVRTHSALLREREELEKTQQELSGQAQQRKKEAELMETRRAQAQAPSELDEEARERSMALLAYANKMIEEQEDEIKKMNELIAQAKVYAIRDAQLAEKDAIRAELAAEERRLDELMEYERVRALREFEERDVTLRERLQQCALDIRSQIAERREQRLIEEELRDQETQALLQQMARLQDEERTADQRRRDAARKLLDEAAVVNEESQKLKQQRAEAERLEDQRVAEYLKEKQAREEAAEAEKAAAARAKEREIARLRALQEQAQDKVAERHAVEARRQQDELERQWRRKEAEKARKEADVQAQLRRGREAQVAAKQHFVDLQMMQDKAEFERVLQAQREQQAAEQAKAAEQEHERRHHRDLLLSQIHEKERQLVDDRKAFFEEGARLNQEAQARRQRLDDIKARKLAELQALGIDGKYLGPVKRLIAATSPKGAATVH